MEIKSNLKFVCISALIMLGFGSHSNATEVPISGTVQSRCVIHADTPGVYGNPSPNTLSTDPVDGGIPSIIRIDVASANSYRAVIGTPVNFTSSPALNDTLAWTGSVSVSSVTDPAMSAYDQNVRTYSNFSEFDLSVAGTVWFKANSKVVYGYNKSLPGGTYRSVVTVECIAR